MSTDQIVPQELHDESGILVAFFTQGVEFCQPVSYNRGNSLHLPTSNSLVKGLLGKMAGLIRGVEDFVVKDGEVERET